MLPVFVKLDSPMKIRNIKDRIKSHLTNPEITDISKMIDGLLATPQSIQRDEKLHEYAVALFESVAARDDNTVFAKVATTFATAGDGGNTAALIDYARCLWNGWGVTQDRDAALATYQKAGELGSDYGAYMAANNLYWHFKRYDEAFCWAEKARKLSDDPDGAIDYLLGLMAHNGRGRPKNMMDAFRLHAQAAERGNADAQFEMSLFLFLGLAGKTHCDDAMAYLFKAAEQNHPRACLNLGAFYATGKYGLPIDEKEAYRWYVRAAEAGSAPATGRLAVMSLLGQGTPVDASAAKRWISRADREGFDIDELLEANGLQRP